MLLTWLLGGLAVLSLALVVWQFVVAMRFPLHQRVLIAVRQPGVTLLKPLKGSDAETAACLQSWLEQDYGGVVQVLFGVASANDPVCDLARRLIAAHPKLDAQLVICSKALGANAKASTLAQLEPLIRHDILIISDADVRVPGDLISQVVAQLSHPGVGLVNCLYRLANPANLPMRLEAVAINADFWSQVLQAQSLKPLDFALGAVMGTTRARLAGIGGFAALVDFLADDYQLGHRIAAGGGRIELSPVVVECWSAPMPWREVWAHQLRWARTIRACQPGPYFLSILNNATFWVLLFLIFGWLIPGRGIFRASFAGLVLGFRGLSAGLLQWRLAREDRVMRWCWLAPVYDVLRVGFWALSFIGSGIYWRGHRFRVQRGGRLVQEQPSL